MALLLPLVTANPLTTGVDRTIRTDLTETRCHHHDGRLATVVLEATTPTEDELERVSAVYLVPLREQDLPKPLLVQHGASGDFLLFVREGSEEAIKACFGHDSATS